MDRVARVGRIVVWCLPLIVACKPAAEPKVAAPVASSAAQHDHAAEGSHDHAEDHGHDHDMPASFAEGVARLESLSHGLSEKLASDASEAADDAVHDIGHMIEAVRSLATNEGLAEKAAAGLDEIEACFGAVDEAFHSADEKADPKGVLAGMTERLEKAFAAVKEVK